MSEIYRAYIDADYEQCEELVNKAWGFDKIFSHESLSSIAKRIYTKGSVLGSNHRTVIERDGKVAGFLFGLNAYSKKPGRNLLFSLGILWRLMKIKTGIKNEKVKLLNAMQVHEKNRASIVQRGHSEIVLLVVAEECQGRGYGKKLWDTFLDQCEGSGIPSIIVETNTLGASTFYEHLGFQLLGKFDSPLHELAAKGGQACMYEYSCK